MLLIMLSKLTPTHNFSDTPGIVHVLLPMDERPLPPSPLGLASSYMRLLNSTRHISNVPLPPWSNPDIAIADQITMEFRLHKTINKAHLTQSLIKAVNKNPGRMGRVETDNFTGATRVLFFVNVDDCLGMEGDQELELENPPPRYERGEDPPPYAEGTGAPAIEQT